MEIKINKLILDNAIETVAKAVDPNPFHAALKGIIVEAQGNKIIFIGSNGEISIKHTIEANIDTNIITPGKILIELSIFRNVIKKLDGDILLKSDPKLLTVSTDLAKFELNLYNPIEYPQIDFEVYGQTLKINWNVFKNIVKNVAFAASNSDTALILNCVNISAANKQLKLIATDRYRLAQETLLLPEDIEFNVSILSKNLKDLLNFEFNKEVTFNISDYKIVVEIENTIIQSKIMEQIYQDVSRAIPKTFGTTLTIDRKELSSLLNTMSVLITDNYNKINLFVKENKLILTTSKSEIASAVVSTQNFKYDSDDLKLTLNAKYLRDAISVFDDEIKLNITPEKGKIVVTSESNKNNIQTFGTQRGFY